MVFSMLHEASYHTTAAASCALGRSARFAQDPGKISYSDVGGLTEQIRQVRSLQEMEGASCASQADARGHLAASSSLEADRLSC